MYKLEILNIAKEDIDNIIEYIANNLKNKTAARSLLSEIKNTFKIIKKFPYGNPEYNTIIPLKYKYRVALVNQYLIFYTIEETTKTIIIARIIYQKRNIMKILK